MDVDQALESVFDLSETQLDQLMRRSRKELEIVIRENEPFMRGKIKELQSRILSVRSIGGRAARKEVEAKKAEERRKLQSKVGC